MKWALLQKSADTEVDRRYASQPWLSIFEAKLMKCVFTATTLLDNADVEILKALLDEQDIPCMVRNDQLSSAMGEIPQAECSPEIWIMNDEDKPRAQAIVDSWRKAKVKTMSTWVCRCNETIEGQFTSCWHCGRERPER